MPRYIYFAAAALLLIASTLMFSGPPRQAFADLFGVSQVSASAPSFGPGQALTITVVATDDDGNLTIQSSKANSKLTVTNCSGLGSQVSGQCDGSGMAAVVGQGTTIITIQTNGLDSDSDQEQNLVVTLTLTASCDANTAVTVSADEAYNAGPDDVTVNCVPPSPTPSPSPSPSPTVTATATGTSTPIATSTATPIPTSTLPPTPPPLPPTATPITQVLQSVSIRPPSTGDAGLASP